jgi:Icc-related predicted phosphoesterase
VKLLLISDEEDKYLWEYYRPGNLDGVDLILSAGDLKASYLSFLVTMANRPLLYVHGNHDWSYDRQPPEGCDCIDDRLVVVNGLRILGLGGSMRYGPGENMYSESEMQKRVKKLNRQILKEGGFDIMVTHAPAAGYGDLTDLPHRGFECFNSLLEIWKPAYLVHGHVHKSYGTGYQKELVHRSGTKIVNACGHQVIEIDVPESAQREKRGSFLYDLYQSMKRKR